MRPSNQSWKRIAYPDGVSLLRGDGTAAWFATSPTGFASPPGSFSELEQNIDGSYTLNRRWGDHDEFNASGLLTANVDRHGNETSYQYIDADSDGVADELAQKTDPFGRETSYQYVAGLLDDVTDKTDAEGNQSTFERNERGQVIRATGPDPDGAGPLFAPVTSFEYGTAGNVSQITNPDGGIETRTYDAVWNQLTSETDPLGRQTLYTLDSATGDVLEIRHVVGVDDRTSSESDDAVTSFTYTAIGGTLPAGLPLSQTDPLGHTTQYTYQTNTSALDFGEITAITVAAGTVVAATTTFSHDAVGNLTSQTDPLGRTITYTYDNLDRKVQTTLPDPDGSGPLAAPVITFDYDPTDNLIRETDPMGRQTEYAYDGRANVITVTRPDHDGDSNLTITTFTYDAADRLVTQTDPRGGVTTYGYDKDGRVTTLTQPDPDGAGPLAAPVWSYAYDARGLLGSETDPLGNVTSYQYDAAGRPTSTLYPDPTGPDRWRVRKPRSPTIWPGNRPAKPTHSAA